MTDVGADGPEGIDENDRLPWLEAVEEDERDGPSAGKLIAAVVIGLVAIGLIVGGLFWIGSRSRGDTGAAGEPEVIAAPQGDYKVKPDSPGGMNVQGQGDSSFAATQGADPAGQINTNAVPETPVAKGQQPAQTAAAQPAAQPKPAEGKPATPAPAAPAAGGGATIQLGAFSSQASANSAWAALSKRFTYLAPLTHSVTPVTSGSKTLYRLRASGPDSAGICGRLRVAGESCVSLQ
jgi:hypothetical protein